MNRLALLSQTIGSAPSSYSKILLEKKDKVATVWLNSLKDLNCLSILMTKQLKMALQQLDNDNSVKVIIIRSKHSKIFCAGADIKNMKQNDYASDPHSMHFISVERAFKNIRKPVISVVQGKALGGGFQLALLTDIIVANNNASFALPQINLGLIPGMGGTQILTRIVGTKKAMQLIFTGQLINAQEAQNLNIVRVIRESSFESDFNKFVDSLVNKASSSIEAAKRSIKFSQQTTLEQGLEHQTSIFQSLFNKPGPAEGLSAFVEKRKPNFRNI